MKRFLFLYIFALSILTTSIAFGWGPEGRVFTEATRNAASADVPTINDDAQRSYKVGDKWIDETNDNSYECLDNTIGAAIWKRIISDDGNSGISVSGVSPVFIMDTAGSTGGLAEVPLADGGGGWAWGAQTGGGGSGSGVTWYGADNGIVAVSGETYWWTGEGGIRTNIVAGTTVYIFPAGITAFGTDGSSVSGASNIWIVNDPTGTSVTVVSDGKGGATAYIGGYSLGDDVLFGGATVQSLNHDPLRSQTITAAAQAIGVTGYSTVHVDSDADYTLTTTPSIVGGYPGQVVYLHNKGSFDIDFQDNSVLAGTSFFVGNADGMLRSDGTMLLQFDSDVTGFRVISNANTAAAGANAELLDVRNASGGVLAAGDAVFIDGWHVGSSRPTVSKSDADDSTKMPAIGIVAAAIANNANGEVITAGSASGQIDTSTAAVGDGVWVSATAGGVIFNRPATDAIQKIGEVARSNVNGVVVVFGAGRTNDVPHEIPASGVSVAAKAGGASGVTVFDVTGASVFQVDTNGAFVNTPTLPKHIVDKAYVDTAVGGNLNIASVGAGNFTTSGDSIFIVSPCAFTLTGVSLFGFMDAAGGASVYMGGAIGVMPDGSGAQALISVSGTGTSVYHASGTTAVPAGRILRFDMVSTAGGAVWTIQLFGTKD